MYPVTIVFLFVSILASCRTTGSGTGGRKLQEVVDGILGDENRIKRNESGTFALCEQKPTADHARRQYRFVVIRLKDNAIVYEGTFSMGYVQWLDDKSIEVVSGSPSADGGSTKKIIHVNSLLE